jgi:hypothetical protein
LGEFELRRNSGKFEPFLGAKTYDREDVRGLECDVIYFLSANGALRVARNDIGRNA